MTVADDQPEEATQDAQSPDETPEGTPDETPDGTPEGTRDETPEGTRDETPEGAPDTAPETPEERLDALGAEIDRVRQQADDPIEEEDPRFIEKGEEEPVDDTIAPPG